MKDTIERTKDTEQTDHPGESTTGGQITPRSSNSSSHQPSAMSTRQSAMASSQSSQSAEDREQSQLDHKRKSSRLSSMRHHTRKRIEREHLMDLQAQLRTINANLRQENQSLRNLIQQFRAALSMNTAQAVASTEANTTGFDQKAFINNVVSLFQVLNDSDQLSTQYEPQLAQLQSGFLAPPAPPAHQPPPASQRTHQMELLQHRLNQVPLHQTQELFPFSLSSRPPLHPASLPYAAAPPPENPMVNQPTLDLLSNYSFRQQQGAFGGHLPPDLFLPAQATAGLHLNAPLMPGVPRQQGLPEGEDEDEETMNKKPKAKPQESGRNDGV